MHWPLCSMSAESRIALCISSVSDGATSVFGPPVDDMTFPCDARTAFATSRELVM